MSVILRQQALAVGKRGEALAQEEYRSQGFEIVSTNFFNRTGKQFGEIDFVARNEKLIVFVEVKTRTQKMDRYGGAAHAVGFAKRRKLLNIVSLFLARHRTFAALQPRIDVCVVILDRLDNMAKNVTIIANAVEDF